MTAKVSITPFSMHPKWHFTGFRLRASRATAMLA